ncbi:MAG: glycosyltransferase [Verrucomicrobia bacterium]|nr:glycosyltransferase [Verrucomicrobiota bacterium]
MKRLLFISNLFPDESEPYRGLDNVTALHALRERGWDIRVLAPRPWFPLLKAAKRFTPRTQDAPFQPRYVPALYLPKIGGLANHHLMVNALRRGLRGVFADFEPDVTLASWLFPDGWAAWKAMRERAGHPVVLLAQGSDVHRYLKSAPRRRAILDALAATQGCICRSKSLATMLVEAGAEAGKLHPVHNGIDTAVFRPSGPMPEGASVPTEAPVLLFVGNLLPVKDPEFLLKAFAGLMGRVSGHQPHLVLAGKGPMRESLEALAERLGIRERTHFIGPQAAPEIAAWMRRSSLLVMTSRNEGLPNVILESQACGLPAVATDVGGIHEVVDAPSRGRLTPPGDMRSWTDAVVAVLQNPPSRDSLAEIGGARTWPAAALAYEQVLDAAIKASR